jgi:hypothetical protein
MNRAKLLWKRLVHAFLICLDGVNYWIKQVERPLRMLCGNVE